jgi:hypothetical protein
MLIFGSVPFLGTTIERVENGMDSDSSIEIEAGTGTGTMYCVL